MVRSILMSSCLLLASLPAENRPIRDGHFRLSDQNGKLVETLAASETRVLVLIFAATDCPISNRYVPEIARMERGLKQQGVQLYWVFPNPEETAAGLRQHDLDFASQAPLLIDSSQDLVSTAHVSVTPEAAVFAVKAGTLREVYHGRVDDRYIALGSQRPQATHHDLEQAIGDVLAHRPVSTSFATPVGCSIVPNRP